MKKAFEFLLSFLLFFLLFTEINSPQEKQLFGFGPIDWNSSKEEVEEIMKDKFNLILGYEKEEAIGFEGGKYFGQNIYIWVFYFNEDNLNEAELVIKNINSPVGSIFYEVVHNMVNEYGDPELFKPDDWTAEWFFYDFPGKKLNATIKISPYSNDKMTSIKITFLKI